MSFVDPPLPGVLIDPNGQEAVVNITNALGTAASAFVDVFAVTPLTFPITVGQRTTIYLAGEGPWTISAKVNGNELAGQVLGLEGSQVGTVTLPVPLTAGQYASLQTDAIALANTYKISGSQLTYTGSNVGQKITVGAGHDFQIGHGIRLYGAGPSAPDTTPSTPTIANVGTTGSTTYQYQVASILANSNRFDALSAASTAGSTTTGNATLNSTNYNQVQFTPPTASGAWAVYGRTSGSMQLLGTIWMLGPVHYSVANNTGTTPPYLGGNLATTTTYTYYLTGVDFLGNESPALKSASVTTGGSVTGVNVFWDFINDVALPYQYYNIYRQTGAGSIGFMQQVNTFDRVWQDYGGIAPTGQTPPTVLTFNDTGIPALTGAPGRPRHVPVAPPAAGANSSLFTTVTAVTPATVTVAGNPSATLSGALVEHDDSAAINTALTALGVVTLPNGYYNIGQKVTIPAGGKLRGAAPPQPLPVTVTATTNPLPNPAAVTLCFSGLGGQNAISAINTGVGLENVQFFWPNQTNGSVNSTQSVLPYPPSVYASNLNQRYNDIVDCNSWVGIHSAFAGAGWYKNIWVASLRFAVLGTIAECEFDTFKGDPGTIYSNNVNLVQAADRTALRLYTGSSLAQINNIAVDGCTPVWFTTGNNAAAGGGAIGAAINNVWVDDHSPQLVLDCPASEPYNSGGAQFAHQVSNFFGVPGSTNVNISALGGSLVGGANLSRVTFSNCYLGNVNVSGQLDLHIVGGSVGTINSTATSARSATGPIKISLVGPSYGVTTRINTVSGNTKVMVSTALNAVPNHFLTDTVTGGNLYVIDEQGMVTEKFLIAKGTVLSTGANTIGNIVLPQQSSAASNLYVISASGSGTTATDTWTLNGTTLFTTATTVSSLKVGAAGEGVAGTGSSPNTALFFFAGTAGSSFNVLPVVLNVNTGLTTTTPLECRITYCISPLSA